jgi:hypothetical protein
LCWKKYIHSTLPLETLSDYKRKEHVALEKIMPTNTDSIGWLEHSRPLLYPEAIQMVNDIGNDFLDSLNE